MLRADSVIDAFRKLSVWKRGGVRAPHKPLLVLWALGRLREGARLIPFEEVDSKLARLLEEFGPPRKRLHPEYPFFRLQNDGVWEVPEHALLRRRQGNTDPLRSELLQSGIAGGFPESIYRVLIQRPEVVREVAKEILEAHFPDSIRTAIAREVGLDLQGTDRHRIRDTGFREAILVAWEHQCAFCGYGVKLDGADLGLEAAHIRWVQAGGPDTIKNGLACCSLHHLAFDRGGIGISDEGRILVSTRLHGGPKLAEYFVSLSGRPLRSPNRKDARPRLEFVRWHREQVFRGDIRDSAD
jgi:putative restriction endonuclease